jgi:hypothetical protein
VGQAATLHVIYILSIRRFILRSAYSAVAAAKAGRSATAGGSVKRSLAMVIPKGFAFEAATHWETCKVKWRETSLPTFPHYFKHLPFDRPRKRLALVYIDGRTA